MRDVYRFSLGPNACIHQVRELLLLAAGATRVLHRKAGRMEVACRFAVCKQERVCLIDASTPEGEDVSRILQEFLRAVLGDTEFTVARIVSDDPLSEPWDL